MRRSDWILAGLFLVIIIVINWCSYLITEQLVERRERSVLELCAELYLSERNKVDSLIVINDSLKVELDVYRGSN